MSCDREKLIELLKHAPLMKRTHGVIWVEAMAQWLIDNGVTFAKDTDVPSKWISVEEQKPNGWVVVDPGANYREPETYIVFVKGAMLPTTAYYLDGKFVPPCDGFLSRENCDRLGFTDDITHWMPMPEPPKD